ncbi:MAG: hypothetical protein CVV42_09380 [Candidatus Riflebacteria bacterium HGW-Riflebacteria-2]|nr:MAG: hypothetical protein CVV42_09380 [Candidatus Riflebacteria bacterium HGW-Riflebacteria-2]
MLPGTAPEKECIKKTAGDGTGQKDKKSENHATTIALAALLRSIAVGAVDNPSRQFASASETIHLSSP